MSKASKAVLWIQRNAVFSHDPCAEHIRITAEEWRLLLAGKIPPERKHIMFKATKPAGHLR